MPRAYGDSTDRLKQWALTLLFWDGMLPPIIALISSISAIALKNHQGVGELLALITAVAFFLTRMVIGKDYFAATPHYFWQLGVFLLALFVLAVLDITLILFRLIPQAITFDDWIGWGVGYTIYLALMAIALFPRSLADESSQS
jgi:hypothetical protein